MTLILASLTVLLLSHVGHCLWFERKQLSLKEEVKELKDVILTLESMESKAIKDLAKRDIEYDKSVTDHYREHRCIKRERPEEWPEIVGIGD